MRDRSFAITLMWAVAVAAAAAACGRGGGREPVLAPGELRGTLAPLQELEWRVEVAAGQLVRARLSIEGLEAELWIEGPDGTVMKGAQRNVLPRTISTVAGPGRHRIGVRGGRGVEGGAPGRFVLVLDEPKEPDANERRRSELEALETQTSYLLAHYEEDATRTALELLRRVRAGYAEIGEREAEADVLVSIAYTHEMLGERHEAKAAAVDALAAWQHLGHVRGEIMGHEWVGRTANSLGDTAGALAALDRAVELARTLPAPSADLARALSNRSAAQVYADAWGDGIASLEEAITLHQAVGDRAAEAFARHNLASAYAHIRDLDAALEHQEEAAALARQMGDARIVALMVGELANIRQFAGDVAGARAPAEEALALYRELGDPVRIAGALAILGTIERRAGDPAAALAHHREAEALMREVATPAGIQTSLGQIGDDLLALGDAAGASAVLREAIELADAAGSRSDGARFRVVLAQAARRLGEPPERVIADVEPALARYEELRADLADADMRRSYFTGVRAAYELYVELLVDAGRVDAAFTATERARARSLLEALRGAPVAPDLDVASVQRWLAGGETVVVELALGTHRSFAWVIDGRDVRLVELGPRAPLEALARAVVQHASSDVRAIPAQTAALRELGARLLQPIAGDLGRERVVFVPDGALHLVPFAALPHPETGEPLIESVDVATLPSAAALEALRTRANRRAPRAGSIAILADPVFAGDDLRLARAASPAPAPATAVRDAPPLVRLHASRDEAQVVAARFPGRAFVALDSDASRAALARPEVRRAHVVHLATHGILDVRHPESSGLVLSRYDAAGAPIDGFVPVAELGALGLAAELVVLSACHTAMGKLVAGEGVRGLSHALLGGGTPRVVATLWAVEDAATARLMEAFYAALGDRSMDHAAALRSAQQALRRDPRFRAPYYWAGFVAYGDWR